MIALTGAGGFIGSVVLGYLNRQGITDVYLFDDLPEPNQFKNLIGKRYLGLHSTKEIVTDIKDFDYVIHIGANSNTLEKDWSSIYDTNVLSTRRWHDLCREHDKKFIFTSSAAVYGNGQGPLNQYAFSKLASEQEITNGVILRLFNVYGPNEYHKGRMASTILHWFDQIKENEEIKIFENSKNYYRDFVWVEDIAKTIYHFMFENYQPGIYDLGSGSSIDFETVADLVIANTNTGKKRFVDMPDDLKKQYQINTLADMQWLINAGVDVKSFTKVHEGIATYIDYLAKTRYY
jgi:ADP-L-glycero-D-manno-heptose 6-epimerase